MLICLKRKRYTFKLYFTKKFSLVLLCFCLSLSAQNKITEKQLFMSNLGVDDGLSAGLVSGIAQDRDGYMWFGTSDGLNRYDGHRFKRYFHDSKDPNSLTNNYITEVFIDSRDWLWIITSNHKLHIYNKEEDNFIKVPVNYAAELFEDNSGRIWYHTSIYEREIIPLETQWTITDLKKFIDEDFKVFSQSQLFPNLPDKVHYKSILFSKNTGLWLHKNDTLYNYNLSAKEKHSQLFFKTEFKSTKFKSKAFTQLNEKSNGELIIASDIEKMLIVKHKNQKFTYDLELFPMQTHKSIAVKYVDAGNRIWLTSIFGIFRFNTDTMTWDKIKLPESKAKNEQLLWIDKFYQDKNNVLWMGSTGYGIFKCTPAHDAIKYFGNENAGPSTYQITDYGENEVLLFHNNESPLFNILNYKDEVYKDIAHKIPNTLGDILKKHPRVFIDSKKNLWFTLHYKPAYFELHKIKYLFDENQSIDIEKIDIKGIRANNLFEHNEDIWAIGCANNVDQITLFPYLYLFKWSESAKEFILEGAYRNLPDNFLFGQFMFSHLDADNVLWFGFDKGGLVSYDINKKSWQHFYKESTSNPLPSNHILSIEASLNKPQTNFWLGTRDGLVDFNFKNNSFQLYDKKQGLPNNTIYGVLHEDENHVWLSSNRGLTRFNPTKKTITNYDKEDGLQHSEFNRWAFLKKEDGTLFFGGVGGLSWFHPNKLRLKEKKSPIIINGLIINGKRADSLLLKNEALNLSHKQNQITFEFAKLDYSSKKRNPYAYKLEWEGSSEDWTDIGTTPERMFTNLLPGGYRFILGSYNNDGTFSELNASIDFFIQTPWWQTIWFKLLIIAILGAIMYYIWFVRLHAKLRLEKLRNSLSRDLHDEIGSTLSSISLFGAVAEQEVETNPKNAKKLIKQMDANATESIVAMNDIVWTLKHGNDTVGNLLNRIRFYTSEMEGLGHWNVTIYCEKKVKKVKVDIIKFRNIFLILKEGLNNAFKYSEGSEIILRIYSKSKSKHLIIEIEDNGIGFDLNSKALSNGNGLNNMTHRAEHIKGKLDIKTSKGKGTKLKLEFSI